MSRSIRYLYLLLALTACTAGPAQSTRLDVVATTTILGDVARAIVQDDADVQVLLPLGADPHDYRASSRQVAALQQADLVIANGLLLEEGLVDALAAARADGANILEVAPLLDPIQVGDGERADPHVWMDPVRMADAALLIAAELAVVEERIPWAARAEAYAGELLAAHQLIDSILAPVPNRKMVTNHDSLAYFAQRYAFEVVGVVIPGGSTLADPSSAELAALVEVIERQRVKVIFVETTQPSELADALAAEVGDLEVVELFTGSLGEPGSGADTLIGMLVTNAERIAGALS